MSIRDGDRELTAQAFDKEPDARVTQGDIVDNKLLGAVLSQIRFEQLARDEARRRNARTRRERRLLEKRLAGARAGGPTGHF